jgi:hypothetical protein
MKWPRILSCITGLGIALLGWCFEFPDAGAQVPRTMNVKISLEIPQESYLVSESIPVEMKLTNPGPSSIQVPDPTEPGNRRPIYSLAGPGYEKGTTFTYGSAIAKGTERGNVPLQLRRLAPGESVSDAFFLGSRVALKEPGEYRLSAQFDWEGVKTVSETRVFTLRPNAISTASLAMDMFADSVRSVRAVWIGQGAGTHQLGETVFYQDQHDMVMTLNRARSIQQVGPQAEDPFCPSTNFSRASKMAAWYGWREGNRLLALPMNGAPLHLDFPQPFRIIRAPLMPPSTDLDVFLLSGDSSRLMLARFHHPDLKGTTLPPKLLWTQTLEAPAVAAAATLSAEAAGSQRLLVITAQDGATLLMTVIDAGDAGNSGPVRTLRIPNAYALPDSQPASYLRQDRSIWISVVISTNPEHTELALVDAVIPEQAGNRAEPKITPISQTKNAPKGAATVFDISQSGTATRDWAVLLTDGQVIHAAAGNRVKLASPPVLPLELVRLAGSTYVLSLQRDGRPELALLR